MSSASVQSTSIKPPEAGRTSTRGTDSSTSSCRLSKGQNNESVRESISSFPSQRSSNVANQATYSTRSCSQDNVPHSSTTSVTRSSTSRFASQTLASKTNSSISGFFLGQTTESASEKPHFWYQAPTSEPVNASNFADTRKRRASNVPLAVSSSNSLEIRPKKYCSNKEGSRIPSEDLTYDRPKTISHSGESNSTYTDNGKARFVKKTVEAIVGVNEKRANSSTGVTVDNKESSSALRESSSCSTRLVAIPFGSIPIDIVVGCGSSRDGGFLKRTASVVADRSGNLANSSVVDRSVNRRPSNTDSSITTSSSSTSNTSADPLGKRTCFAAETDAIGEDIRVGMAPSSISSISSCDHQFVENRCPENVPQHDILLRAPTSECSIDIDDSMNTSSISNVHLSVSQTDANRKKPLLHMTISSNSDVEFLFNRTPSETSTRTELSIVVKIPRSGAQTDSSLHITKGSGSSLEQCKAAVDKLYPIVNTDGSRPTGFSAVDNQLSIRDPDRPSLEVSGDDGSGVHRYVLRCQDRMVPSTSDPATQQMAFVCTIEQKQCESTGEKEDVTCAPESQLQVSETLQKELKSLAVLQEDNSCSDRVTACCSALVSHASSVSGNADSHLKFVGASHDPVTHTENHNIGFPSESVLPCNTQLSIGDLDRPSVDVSGNDGSGVHRYVLRCQDRMVPSASDPATQQMAFVCTVEEKQCESTGDKEDMTCTNESQLQVSETLQKELKSLAVLREDNSCSDMATDCGSASVSDASSESILLSTNRNSLRNARAYFKELCSRYGNCSTANKTMSDTQPPSESSKPKEKSDHLSNSAAKSDAKSKTKMCFRSSRYLTDCSSKPTKLSNEFSNSRNNGTKTDKVLCCKPSAENDLEHDLEERDDESTMKVSKGNIKSSKSLRDKSDPDFSDGSVRLSGVPDAKSKTSASVLKLYFSVSGSSLGSGTEKNIAHNVEDTKKETAFMNLLAEETHSTGFEKTAKSQTDASTFATPVDVRNLDIHPPEDNIQIDSKNGSSFHALPNSDIVTELTQSLPSQPFVSEEHLPNENATAPFPPQSESMSSDKRMEKSEQLPTGKVKNSYTKDKDDIASSMTQRKETDSETGLNQTSSDFDSEFHDDDQTEMADYSVGYSQDERQIYQNNGRCFFLGSRNTNQKKLSKLEDIANSQLHHQRCQSGCFSDSPVAAETPTGMRLKNSLSDFNCEQEFTQSYGRKSTSIRTHPKRKARKQSLHSHTGLLHLGYQSDDFNPGSTEHVTKSDEYSSDGLESNTTLPYRSDEYDDQVVQIPNSERAVRDHCGCKTEPRRSRNKPFHSDRKDMPTRTHASHVEHECVEKHKESDFKVERKRKHGADKNILVVTDDNVNFVPENKRRKRTKNQPITDYRFSLSNLRRRIDDICGGLNVIAERYDDEGFQQRKDGKAKDNASDHDSWAKNNLRSNGTLIVQSKKKEQHILSNSIHNLTAFEQHNTTSTFLECNDWSSFDKPLGFVGFGRESKHEANDCFPEIESVVRSSVADKKMNKGENRVQVKKRRHKRKKNDRIPKAKPENDDCNKPEDITSISCSNKTTDHESMSVQCSNEDNEDCNIQFNRFLTTDTKEKSRMGFCREFEVEERKTSVVPKNELQLNATLSDPVHRNSDETESDSEHKDALYFDRLHKEFELVAAHQRKLDEFTLLGPECSAILRECEAQELREIGLKTNISPPATYPRHHSSFPNQESDAQPEEKTDQVLYQGKFSGGVDGIEDGKGRPQDASENGKNRLPCEDAYNDLRLKADKLERKKDRGTKRRNTITASRHDDDFSNEHHKFTNKPNCSCAELENGYFSHPCDNEESVPKLSNCPDWTTGRGAIRYERIESSSYLETWIERNFEPIVNPECVNLEDTPSYECSVIPTCGRRIADFEMDAEEENKCSYLSSAIVNHEITMNGYGRKDSRSKGRQKTDSKLQSQCGTPCDELGKLYEERGMPCDGRRDCRSKEKQETNSQLQYDCDKPRRQSPCRMIDVTKAAVDTGAMTEKTSSTNYRRKHEHDQVEKKQRKTKSKRKASNAASFEPDSNIPELLETKLKDETIETLRTSNKPETTDQQTLHKSLSEFVDDSKEKSDRKVSYREPAQPEEMLQKLNENKDGTTSKNDEDKDKSRGNENKIYLATDDNFTSDKNETSSPAAAIQVSSSLTHDYIPEQIPVEAKQLHQAVETNDKNDESEAQMNQKNRVRSENEDNEALESDKHVELNDKKQDGTKSVKGASHDDSLGSTDNVLFTETEREMPNSRHVAEDDPFKTTDENQLYSTVDRENREEEIQVRSSLTYDRLPVQEPLKVSGGIALSYLDTGEDKETSPTVEREAGNLNSAGTQAETDFELPERKETIANVDQTARNDGISRGNSVIGVNEVDRSKLMMGSDQTDQRGSRNSRDLTSQPPGTDKRNLADVSVNINTQNLDARTDDFNFKGTFEEGKRAGNVPTINPDFAYGSWIPGDQRTPVIVTWPESAAIETRYPDFAYGSTSLEQQETPIIVQWPEAAVVDKNTMAGPISSQDRHSHLQRPLVSYGEAPDTATKKTKGKAKKSGLLATLDSPRELENKRSSPLSPMESFQKMLREGMISKNKNKNLLLSSTRRYTDQELVHQSERHSLGLMMSSGTSISHVVNPENPSGTGVNWTEYEAPGSRPEQFLSVIDYSKRDSNVEVPVEEPAPDDIDRIWRLDPTHEPDLSQDSATRNLMWTTEKAGSGSYEKDAEASNEDRRQEEMKTEDSETAERHLTGIEPSTPEYATLRELDWVSRQLLRCRRESEKLMKDKSLIQLKLLKLKDPQTSTGDAENKEEDLEEEEEQEEEEEENALQQLGFYAWQKNDATLSTFPLDQLRQLRRHLERCQKGRESAQQQRQAAQMELDKMLQKIPEVPQPSSQSKKRTAQTGHKNGDHDVEVKGHSSAEVNPVVVGRPYYYTMMMVTEGDTCSRQFYSQVRSLLTKLRAERSDCSCGDEDFKEKMLWILWHQRQEAFRELGEWERLLRRMNIPAGTVGESLRQLQRQMGDQIAEINDNRNEISQLRIQKMRMEQTMSEHIRQLMEDRWRHAVLVKTLRQRNDFLMSEVQSRKTAEESSETSSQLRDRKEIQSLRAEICRLVARLKVTDDCFAQRCPVNALRDSRSQFDDMKNKPEDDEFILRKESSSNKVEGRADSTSRRRGTTEEDLNRERTSWIREKDDLVKKLKFRDKVIDELRANAKDRSGWPSFQLADSTRSKEPTKTAAKKPHKNSNWTEHRLQLKTPFSSRFHSEARIDQNEGKKGEKQMNGGWSSPLLASHPSPLDTRNYRQKQLRVLMQPLNCGNLTQRHLVTDSAKVSSRFDVSCKDLSLVDLDRDVESEYEALLGQRHRKDLVATSSAAGQLSEIVRRMEKLESLVNGQHLLLTVIRARMTSLDDDNEFLRQQLAALRRRTYCEPETDRENNWLGTLENLARTSNDNNAKDLSHGATSDS